MRRADREVTDPERIDEIIKSAQVLHLGLLDEEGVYIVPLNYGYEREGDKRIFYFHSAKEGRKVSALKDGSLVSFELENAGKITAGSLACSGTQYYSSVMGRGSVMEIIDLREKQKALERLMLHATGRSDYSFSKESLKATKVYALTVRFISAKEHA